MSTTPLSTPLFHPAMWFSPRPLAGSFPPKPTAPCTGLASTLPWDQGGQNPGEQPDLLLRLQAGRYYGHPDPHRSTPECVFKDGHYQHVSPLPNYTAPMYILGDHKSADGMIEYRASTFNGALKGNLLITNYSVGDDITRLKLLSDGLSVTSATQLAGGFVDPLPIVEGPDGTIYVGELGANRVTALKPAPMGSWTTKARCRSRSSTPVAQHLAASSTSWPARPAPGT